MPIKRKNQRKSPRARIGLDEHQEQVALFRWAELQKARWPELALMHAIPNGGRRDAVTGAKLKAEGVKAGVPDLCLPVARSGHHGLYIELKTNVGTASKKQLRWLEALQQQGFYVAVCRGWQPASQLITSYLSGKSGVSHERLPNTKQHTVTRRRNHRPGQCTGVGAPGRSSKLRYAGKEDRHY